MRMGETGGEKLCLGCALCPFYRGLAGCIGCSRKLYICMLSKLILDVDQVFHLSVCFWAHQLGSYKSKAHGNGVGAFISQPFLAAAVLASSVCRDVMFSGCYPSSTVKIELYTHQVIAIRICSTTW